MQCLAIGEPFDGGDFPPTAAMARVRQELTRRSSMSTVHAPHWPWSHPFFVPVSPAYSRSASSSVTEGSMTNVTSPPLMFSVTCWAISESRVVGPAAMPLEALAPAGAVAVLQPLSSVEPTATPTPPAATPARNDRRVGVALASASPSPDSTAI
jgi:hypothetical protein